MTTAIASISQLIKEELSFVRKEIEPEVDGIFQQIHETTAGVSRGLGRDWKVIHTFSTGVAGAFKNVSAAGPAATAQGNVYSWDTLARKFPNLADNVITTPGTVQKTITLVEGMGNFMLPYQYFLADRLDASTADAVSLAIRGTAKNVNQSEANHFYAQTADQKHWIEMLAAPATGDGTSTVTIVVDGTEAVGRIGRILPGQTLDWHDSDAADAKLETTIVKTVDYVNKTFVVEVSDGTNMSLTANDFCRLAGSEGTTTTTGPSGAEKWLVDTGSDVFGIDMSTHPQFKSIVAAVTGVLDEAMLNKYVGGFYDAYGGMHALDSIITTTGVLTAYMESIDGLYRYERNNNRLTVKEGWTSIDYAWQGQTFQMMASRYQLPGQAYIMKLGDQNLKRYVPPKVQSTTGRGEFPGDVQFVAPWMGSNTVFLPTRHSDSSVTEMVEAPFVYFREWCPDQLQGVKLTGLTESNP
jgi:hypothetical protein